MTGACLDSYRGRRVMITGGPGVIGSNLARRLLAAGGDVLIVDLARTIAFYREHMAHYVDEGVVPAQETVR